MHRALHVSAVHDRLTASKGDAMATIEGRDRSALLVVDAQQGVFASAHDRDGVIERIGELVDRARAEGAPIVWVRHSSDELPLESPQWQIVDELSPAEGEPIVEKTYGDSFEATDLEDRLAESGVARLVIVGGQTDACVRSTMHGGLTRGYDVTLVEDAHSTEDLREWVPTLPDPAAVIAHTNTYWSFQSAPGRTAAVQPAADVSFAAEADRA